MGLEGLGLSCKMQNSPLNEEKSLLTGETEAVTGCDGPCGARLHACDSRQGVFVP